MGPWSEGEDPCRESALQLLHVLRVPVLQAVCRGAARDRGVHVGRVRAWDDEEGPADEGGERGGTLRQCFREAKDEEAEAEESEDGGEQDAAERPLVRDGQHFVKARRGRCSACACPTCGNTA